MIPHNVIPQVQNAYHNLILNLEVPEISKGLGPPYSIRNPEYEIPKEKIIRLFERHTGTKAEEVFNILTRAGFLVKIKNGYRSLHMDVLVRSAMIRTYWPYEPYILSPRFNVYLTPLPSKEDRTIKPSTTGNLSERLLKALNAFFGDSNLVKIFIEIMKDYLYTHGTWGLDAFQVRSLINLLLSEKRVHVITAPTGTGKTIIFSLYLLAKLMRSRLKNKHERVVLVYPRKVLSVDQAGRLIRLLEISRKHGYVFTLGLRDGTTPKDKEFVIGRIYRGIKCPFCKGDLVNHRVKNTNTVKCRNCERIYDFVCATREEMGRRRPDILVTNMWALEARLVDSAIKDINVHFFSETGLLIIDEAHEYHGLSAGLISVLLKIISKISSPTIILSSATIPSPVDFASKLVGTNIQDIHHHDFFEYSKDSEIRGKRLVILGLYDINPKYSWSTYTQLWAVMMAFIYYSYMLDNRDFKPQSIVFVNNIKELRRIARGYEENISLGEPRDHLFGHEGYRPPPTDGFMYYHYLTSQTLNSIRHKFDLEGNLPELRELVDEMHSQVPSDKRSRVISALKSGKDLAVVLSTSSLELGVDYDNVSFILNSGVESPIVMAQRIGRGGRNDNCLKTVLGIIVTRNIPQEAFVLYDLSVWDKLNPAPKKFEGTLPVATGNPQIIKRGYLTAAMVKMAKMGEKTYASGLGISTNNLLKQYLNAIASKIPKVVEWI